MQNYADWPRKNLSVDSLKLDPINPRLPVDVRNKSQARIRDHLIRNEDVRDIALRISTEGYIPFKPLYVCREKGRYVVLEGNRRTCAMQVLRDESKAPEDKRSWYRRISRKVEVDDFAKVPVVIFPSRSIARRILFFEHAMPVSKKWDRQQRMNFIAESVRHGATIDEISIDLNVPVGDIRTAVIEFMLQDFFEQLGLEPDVYEFATSSDFPLSTLSRIVQNSQFKKATGFNIEGATLEVEISEESFKGLLKSIVETLAVGKDEGGVDSRTLNTSSDIEAFVNGVVAHHIKDEDSGGFSFSPEKIIREDEDETRPKVKIKKKIIRLVNSGKSYATGFPKLDMLIEQAQKMPANMYCIAGGILIRTILEMCVLRLFIMHDAGREVFKPDGRAEDLTKSMRLLSNKGEWFSGGREQLRRDMAKFCQKDSPQYLSIETLNRYVHGPANVPTEETLRAFWMAIEPLVEMCCSVNADLAAKQRRKA